MKYLVQLILIFVSSGKLPTSRAVAAYFKVVGMKVERRWPFISRSASMGENLYLEDLLEFEGSRRRHPFILSVGAFDGVENDPVVDFIRNTKCSAALLEPQRNVFKRLQKNYQGQAHVLLINKALDQESGERELFTVPDIDKVGVDWAEQLASFDKTHIQKHEERAPGVTASMRSEIVQTISFSDLLDENEIDQVDVLHIDAEGLDEKILRWIPFERIQPGLIIYEVAHMSEPARQGVKFYLSERGYRVFPMNSNLDAAAVNV